MDEEFTFLSIVQMGVQLVLFGTPVTKDIVVESHILHGGRLLCKESVEILKNRAKERLGAQNIKERVSRVRPNNNICPECLRLYKKNGHSAYNAWIEGKAKTPAASLPKLNKF